MGIHRSNVPQTSGATNAGIAAAAALKPGRTPRDGPYFSASQTTRPMLGLSENVSLIIRNNLEESVEKCRGKRYAASFTGLEIFFGPYLRKRIRGHSSVLCAGEHTARRSFDTKNKAPSLDTLIFYARNYSTSIIFV